MCESSVPKKPRKAAPPPPTELGGNWSPPRLNLSAPRFNEYATTYLPHELTSAVEAALIVANQKFRDGVEEAVAGGRVDEAKLAELRLEWLWTLLLGFAEAALKMVQAGTWKAAHFVGCWRDFYHAEATAAGIRWELPQVAAELEKSREWKRFEELLLEAINAPVKQAPLKATAPAPPAQEAMPVAEPRAEAPAASPKEPDEALSLIAPGEPPAGDPDAGIESSAPPKDALPESTAPADAAETPSRLPETSPLPPKRRNPGPKPEPEMNRKTAETVKEIVPEGGDWRLKWEDVCEALDKNKVPVPSRWRKKREWQLWADCTERHLAVKAIEYRLGLRPKLKLRASR